MTFTKRIISIYIAFMLIILQIPSYAVGFSDIIEGSRIDEAVSLLASFKIIQGYPDGTFKAENEVTREEFTAMIIRTLGLGDITLGDFDLTFPDVAKDRWSAVSINLAFHLNIIKGFEDGTFRPEDQVTYEQAVKMIVCALGYETLAIENGGYPVGYLITARNLGITKNAEAQQNLPANRGIIATLLYNSLEIDLMEQVSAPDPSYKIMHGKTILSEKLKAAKATGVITGYEGTALTHAGNTVKEGEVEMDGGRNFKFGETNVKDYLGYSVTYYYSTDDMEKNLIMVKPTNSNRVIRISAENVENLSSTFVEYYENYKTDTKTITAELPSFGPMAIYNGKFILNLTSEHRPESGNIKLIDNNNDSIYDVVIINAVKNMVVSAVDTVNYIVYDKYNQANSIILNTNSATEKVTITKSGSPVGFASIKAGDVISIKESLNPTGVKIVDVEIIGKSVTGTVTETSGNDLISIDSVEYELSATYLNYIQKFGQSEFGIEDSGIFYLDSDSKIIAVTVQTAAAAKYGYLIASEAKEKDGFPRFKILGTDGRISVFDGIAKVRINGESVNYYSVVSRLANAATSTNKDPDPINSQVSQLIKYTTNSEGKVDRIITMKTSGDIQKELVISYPYSTEETYKGSTKSLGSKASLDLATKVFIVPSDRFDEDEYGVKTYSSLVDNRKYYFEAYDASTTNVAKIIVLYGNAGTTSLLDPMAPVALIDTRTEISDNGQIVHRLGSYINGVMTYKSSVDRNVLSQYKKGDIIRLSTNAQDKIVDAELIFSPYSLPEQGMDRVDRRGDSSSNDNAEYMTVFGTVYARDDDRMTVSVYDVDEEGDIHSENLISVPFSSGVKYFQIDTNATTPVIASANYSMIAGYTSARGGASKVFVYMVKGETKFILLVK